MIIYSEQPDSPTEIIEHPLLDDNACIHITEAADYIVHYLNTCACDEPDSYRIIRTDWWRVPEAEKYILSSSSDIILKYLIITGVKPANKSWSAYLIGIICASNNFMVINPIMTIAWILGAILGGFLAFNLREQGSDPFGIAICMMFISCLVYDLICYMRIIYPAIKLKRDLVKSGFGPYL